MASILAFFLQRSMRPNRRRFKPASEPPAGAPDAGGWRGKYAATANFSGLRGVRIAIVLDILCFFVL
jgi:hypothetical protein